MVSEAAGRNWAGNVGYGAAGLVRPRSLDELREVVASARRVRALGSRHTFTDLADTDGLLVTLDALADPAQVTVQDGVATVPAGIRHGELATELQRHGAALANLASLPHISVAGAVATGTHGSGDRIGTLATQVRAVELITAGGGTLRLTRSDADFAGAVVALGALGIVTHLELDVEPDYRVAQHVFDRVRWSRALADLDTLTSAGDSVSLFTTWQDAETIDQVWVKTREGGETPDLAAFGGVAADGPRHPIRGVDPTPATEQGGVLGPWFERLPHFRLAFTPSAGAELQSEYLLPRGEVPAAVEALQALAPRIAPLLLVTEVRTMAGDDLWLSGAHGAATVGIHFTWKPDEPAVRALLPAIEAALPETARPHWGKVFELPGDALAERYPRWHDFAALRRRLDPDDVFGNAFLDRIGL